MLKGRDVEEEKAEVLVDGSGLVELELVLAREKVDGVCEEAVGEVEVEVAFNLSSDQ